MTAYDNLSVALFHGTTVENAKKIRTEGLKKPEGASLGWMMLTDNKEDAQKYTEGHAGDPEVLTVNAPKRLLTKGRPHLNGTGYGLLHGHIPAEHIEKG